MLCQLDPIEASNQWDSGKVSSILKYSISFISFYRETRKNVVSFRLISIPVKRMPASSSVDEQLEFKARMGESVVVFRLD